VGGVFGIAILAAVFVHPGDYTSASTFVDHFSNAVWVGAAFSAVGIIAAALLPGRPTSVELEPTLRDAELAVA
jgi:hypothetical protein